MTVQHHPLRSDAELRALLQLLDASGGVCGDRVLRRELVETGFVRRDATAEDQLHLTPEGRRFVHTSR
jgi:hypothetical protein